MPQAIRSSVIVPEELLARSGVQCGQGRPDKRRGAVQRLSRNDRFAAGRSASISALLVAYDDAASITPRALNWAQIGSVPEPLVTGGMV